MKFGMSTAIFYPVLARHRSSDTTVCCVLCIVYCALCIVYYVFCVVY